LIVSLILCIVAIVALFTILVFSIYYNIKFGLTILHVQDAIEASLDVLDERYASISKILEIPLFHDSREVRQVVHDIEASREAILSIARQLTTADKIDEIEENKI